MPTDSTSTAAVPMSSLARIGGVFTAPGRTFQSIAEAPHFYLCWTVEIVAAAGYFWFLVRHLGAYEVARQSMMQSSRAQAMDPATLQNAINAAARFYHFMPLIVGFGVIIVTLVLAALFLGVANFLLGMEAKFKAVLAVVVHAMLPQTLLAVLSALVLALMADPTAFHYVNPLGSNLGFFLDKASTPAFLYAFATHLDVFALWTVVLLGLGLACLSGRRGKFSSSFWAVFALWMFYIIVASGAAAMFA